MYIGAIEAGGTKMVCAIGNEKGQLIERVSIPTTSPEETFDKMITYFKSGAEKGLKIAALGIGCFGPVELNEKSDKYGFITSTPKPGWANVDFAGVFKRALNIPVGFDTDVNAAILGEVTYGAAKGAESAIYITIGTGIGAGVYYDGKLIHGMMHPEAGHIMLAKHPEDNFEGVCPYHKTCFEGMASGPSIEKRYGKKAVELKDNKLVWEIESYYIAQAVANYICMYSPNKIILWGGVMHQEQLFDMVRKKVKEMLNGYIATDTILNTDLSDYIVKPGLGEDPGIIGALTLGTVLLV